MRKLFAILMAVGVAASLAAPATSAPAIDKSDNVKLIKQFKFTGGTELAASGKYVYAGELNGNDNRGQEPDKGGLHIFDVSGKKPKEVSFLHCPGTDNDVEVVKPGLVTMSFSNNKCAIAAGAGLMTIDVSNAKKPRIIGMIQTGKSHTHKPLPGTDYVYMAGGGLSGGNSAGPAIVDVSDPRNPTVAATFRTITTDCHDISFNTTVETPLGFCAGAIGTGEVQIWDVSDPLVPVTLGRIVNPLIQYSHYAVSSTDGQLMAIDDEAFGAHDCNTGQSPTGRVWVYDISIPQAPVLQSSFAAPRGGGGGANVGTYVGWVPSWCLSHGLDWQPNSKNLAVTWFTGGVSVLNFDSPATPSEVAHFQAEDSLTYSTLWHKNRLYTNGMGRGVDVLQIKGLK